MLSGHIQSLWELYLALNNNYQKCSCLEYTLFHSLGLPKSTLGIIAFVAASVVTYYPLVCRHSSGKVACKP